MPVIALVVSRQGELKDRMEELDRGFPDAELHVFQRSDQRENILAEIKALKPDLLVTEDLEGFEMTTLTDSVAYNLIHCRQIHLICRKGLPEMEFLEKQLSLVMHFYVRDPELEEEVRRRNGDVPYLNLLQGPVTEELPRLARELLA